MTASAATTAPAPANGAPTTTSPSTLRKVKVKEIIVLKGFNAREGGQGVNPTSADVQDLAVDIKKNGQQTPVRLREMTVPGDKPSDPPVVKLVLVAGERRVVAIRDVLKLEFIDASIATMSEDGALAEMMVENVRRKNLRPWEIAEGAHKLNKEHGWSGDRIAERVGLSKSYTQNLIRLRDKLAPELYKLFKGPSSGGEVSATQQPELSPTIDFFVSLCRYEHPEQMARWQQKQAGDAVDGADGGDDEGEGEGEGGKSSKGKRGKKKPVRAAKMESTMLYDVPVAIALIGPKGEPDGETLSDRDRMIVQRTLQWALGHFTTKKGAHKPLVTVPVKEEEAEAAGPKKGAKKGAKKGGAKKGSKKSAK